MTRVTASVAASPEASSEPPQRAPRAVTTWPVTSSFTIFHSLHCQLRTHQKETDMLPKLSHKAPHFQLAHLGLPHAKSPPRWGHLQPSPHPAGLCVCARVSAMPSPARALSKHPPLRPEARRPHSRTATWHRQRGGYAGGRGLERGRVLRGGWAGQRWRHVLEGEARAPARSWRNHSAPALVCCVDSCQETRESAVHAGLWSGRGRGCRRDELSE